MIIVDFECTKCGNITEELCNRGKWFYEVDLNKIPECGVLMFDGGCANCPCKDKPECKCPKEGK